MSEIEYLPDPVIRKFAKILLTEFMIEQGMKPKCTKERITQAEALRILAPAKIRRQKLNTYVLRGIISAPRKDGGSRNSQKTYDRQEIYELLNK